MSEWLEIITSVTRKILHTPLYQNAEGGLSISLADISIFLALVVAAFLLGTVVRKWLSRQILPRTGLSLSVSYAIGRIAGYTVTVLFLLVLLQTIGLNLSALALLGGAIGIGIGFGLQNIITNFVSGLIILFERHINVGDRIDLGDLAGVVTRIRARSTEIRTGDNIIVSVPNSEFVSGRVINWSQGSPEVRFRIPFGVAYGSDIPKLERVLIDMAGKQPGVLSAPPPKLYFEDFGDSSLDFELAVWNRDNVRNPRGFRSAMRFAIENALRENDIEIPFPQRDLHLRSVSESTVKHLPRSGNTDKSSGPSDDAS